MQLGLLMVVSSDHVVQPAAEETPRRPVRSTTTHKKRTRTRRPKKEVAHHCDGPPAAGAREKRRKGRKRRASLRQISLSSSSSGRERQTWPNHAEDAWRHAIDRDRDPSESTAVRAWLLPAAFGGGVRPSSIRHSAVGNELPLRGNSTALCAAAVACAVLRVPHDV
jgi:hypothetical protein